MAEKNIHDFTLITGKGAAFPLAGLKDKVLLVVNTASKCGFTPQYKGLEELHKKYADKGLVVLGFPCDQFANQEPGDDAAIAEFCQLNFGVSFPLMKKTDVNGPDAHPLFVELRRRTGGLFGDSIKWNFTKFLVSPGGSEVKRFAPTVDPAALAKDIEKALGL